MVATFPQRLSSGREHGNKAEEEASRKHTGSTLSLPSWFTLLVYPSSRGKVDGSRISWHLSDGLDGPLCRDSLFADRSCVDVCQNQTGSDQLLREAEGV